MNPAATSAPACYSILESPVGDLLLVRGEAGLLRVDMGTPGSPPRPDADWHRDDEALCDAREQLAAYFAGERRDFDLPLAPEGTPFQRRVWKELARIPFGVTVSYAELARRVGRPRAARAVGTANARNPIAIVVPCHRVIGADGTLVGFGAGLERKKWLLEHEAAVLGGGG
jgi:methylated-DNA-[protein]-cysteine S-methyltransferase